jgi:hypothetical protein
MAYAGPPPHSGSVRVVTALQLAFLGWAAVELARGRTGDALALAALFAALQVPRLLRLSLIFDWGFLVAWALQAVGQVAELWSRVPWWDTLVHATLPAVLAPTALLLLIRVGRLPDTLRDRGDRSVVRTVLLSVPDRGRLRDRLRALRMVRGWSARHSLPARQQRHDDRHRRHRSSGLAGGLWLAACARGMAPASASGRPTGRAVRHMRA